MINADYARQICRKQVSELNNLKNMFEAQILRAATRGQYEVEFNIKYEHDEGIPKVRELLELVGHTLENKGYIFYIEYFQNGELKVNINWR